MKRASGRPSSALCGTQKKRQTSSLSGAPKPSATLGAPLIGRKFVNAPSPISAASASIFPRSAAMTIGTGCAGGVSSLKPPTPRSPHSAPRALARRRRAQRPDGLAHLRQRLDERDLVPALDDDVRRRAEPQHEAPV